MQRLPGKLRYNFQYNNYFLLRNGSWGSSALPVKRAQRLPRGTSRPALSEATLPAAAVDALQDAPMRIFSPEEDPTAAEQCCGTIGKGFVSEPNNEFFCPDPARYEERWRAIAHNTLLRTRGKGVALVHSVGADHAAVALVYRYPDQKVPDDVPEPPGTIDLTGSTRPETIPVRDNLLSYMSTKKVEFMQARGSFEYVAFLATRPEYQGQGLGSQLLRHVTTKADVAGRWCYLEATNPDNVRLYERHGFRQLETKVWSLETLPDKRVMLILMARPPAAAAAAQPPSEPVAAPQ